jgi:hypothetical protein
METIPWTNTRPDRSELRPCTYCGANDGDCAADGFRHSGRRWAIGITWPGTNFGSRLTVLTGICQATVEDLHLPDGDRFTIFYRGACLGCGWAATHEHSDSNTALEDALDHVLPEWRRVPITERLGHDPSRTQRDRWLAQLRDLYAAHGLEDRYAPGARGLIRTMRQPRGTRSHWSHGFYDVCAGVVEVRPVEVAPEQMGLF